MAHRFPIRYRVLLILLVLFVGGAMAWLVSSIQQNRARAAEDIRFMQAEQDIDRLTKEIIAATGRPLKSNIDKSCFLRSVKFEKQPISCSVTSDLFYGVNDEKEATKIHKQALSVLDREWTQRSVESTADGKDPHSFKLPAMSNPPNKYDYEQVNIEYMNDKAQMECRLVSAFYFTNNPPYDSYGLNTIRSYATRIGVVCTDNASSLRYRER